MQVGPRPSTDAILVLGAGELGMAVLRALAKARGRPPVSVLLRASAIRSQRPDKQAEVEELRALGIQPIAGDLAAMSVAALAELFGRFDTVVSCIGFAAGRGMQVKLTRAALEAGVPRYVPWQFGVDYDAIGRGSAQDLFDEQLDVRDLLRAQKRTAWVIVSTGMFTSFLFEPAFGVVDLANNRTHALGSPDTAVTVTTPEDIGRLTAEILLAEPPITDQIVHTAGDTLTYATLADTVDAVLNRRLDRAVWTTEFLEAELARDPDDTMKKYRAVFAAGRGVAWPVATTFNGQRGIPVTDVAGWLRRSSLAAGESRQAVERA
ncbi:aromatic alcohol reductase [Rhodoplanes sp. TEM]|uniref:Aromatic alcohol reductase n=1 Tax=Rhodoplanes tepidamans TaxID=200616 RepID=A0ABT5JJ78_RHOTP|nr:MULTISPECIES: aromatic alcohol reductase [Rhodoplanes]MDC7789548.1 aromatic alcohol reductase [Rhodoplanes tepidamans]MDC7986723.1 aromatic alcohol reductase [Rhodoplanes sp. TEM]MDQ0359163.1 NAD(P)-dependent dehydrogenase (short-subunit alcohol dehydrogenase family) [Rhodoplanes tepidamans]